MASATSAYTLPTIHLNGTSSASLANEYHTVYQAVSQVFVAMTLATCNPRDFYPQGDGAYQQACKERDEVLVKLKEVQDYAEAWMARACDSI